MKTRFFVFAFLFALFFIQGAQALGITPGRTSIDFTPNLEKEVGFSIVNTENKDFDIAFSVEGDLASYISISNEVVSFSSGEESKDFVYDLKLPASLPPGIHKIKVVASELSEDLDESEIIIKATVSVVTQLYISVPYPGKFIEANFNIVPIENENVINFYIPFINRGEDEISSIDAVIDIYKENEKVMSLNTQKLSSIDTGVREELSAIWNPNVAPGRYLAKVKVSYDNKKLDIEKSFNIGDEDLGVLGISVNDFTLGDIAKLKILLQNRLSDPISNVVGNLKVYDENLKEIADLKSISYEIPSLSNKDMLIYWDTESLEEGVYGSELNINYDDKFISKNFKVEVDNNMMIFSGVGFVIGSGEGKLKTSSIFGIIIGILVLLNLLWFVWWKSKKSKK